VATALLLTLWLPAPGAFAQALVVDVDVTANAGAVRDLNGVNRRPGFSLRTPPLAVDATELYAAFGVSQVRTHDTGLDLCETYTAATLTSSPPQTMSGCTVSGTPVGGLPTITWTPTSTTTAALDSTANYDFTSVDTALSQIAGTGASVYLRLGESYNGPNNTANTSAWARVAANIYRHVIGTFKPTSGVAAAAPVFVEVHNEPDGAFWRGSAADFFSLFRSTVTEVRAAAAAAGRTVRIGGPGFTSSVLTSSTVVGNPANGFIAGVGADALDFYSAHYYANCGSATLSDGATFLRALRSHINAQGGTSLPMHLTEWNTGLGERCGGSVYSDARMQSWTSGMLTLMQDASLNVEAAHFYSAVPVMTLFDFSTSPGSARVNPSAWAFWAHARLRGMTRLGASVCQGATCLDGTASASLPLTAIAARGALSGAIIISNDTDTAQTYTLRLRGVPFALDLLLRTPPSGVVRASLTGTPGRLSEEAVRSLLGQVTVVSRAGVTPTAGTIAAPLTIPARSLQVIEMRPTGVSAAQLDCILDWGELFYPSLLGPARQPSQSAGEYYFRYYPRTQFYVGTSVNQQQLLLLDGRTGALQMLGPLSTWAVTAGCR
jgi:hypothetical protein